MRQRLRLGLWINDVNAPLRRAIAQAAVLGFSSIELSLDNAEIHPNALSESGRRHLARLVGSAGMTIASIAAPSSISQPLDEDQVIGHASVGLRMARDMGVGLSTLHADIGDDGSGEFGSLMASHVGALADLSDRIGVVLALRGGSMDAAFFSDLLRKVGCPTLRIAFDPVDALLCGKDPIASLDHVSDQLAIAYLRDATPPRGDRSGHACEIGLGGLELDRFLADVSECVPSGRLILRGAHVGRSWGDIKNDIARLRRTGMV